MAEIVVGYDGSPHALTAIEAAAEEARCHAALLRIVYVYEREEPHDVSEVARVTATTMWNSSSEEDDALLADAQRAEATKEARAQHDAQKFVDRLVRGLGTTLDGVETVGQAVGSEKVAEALTEAARDATLLVVGSRGLGGVRGLLGSVSQHCVRHAKSSVLVVRTD